MRRDLDLVRKMVLAIEDDPSGWAPHPLKIEGYSDEQIGYHAYLLIDSGLADGQDSSTFESSSPEGTISHLTWNGHEFAAAARDETRWKKAMSSVGEKAGTVTLSVLSQLLGSLMRGALGLG